MRVVLENINIEPQFPEIVEPEAVEAPQPADAEEADAEEAAVAAPEPTAPAPKKRGRPPKAKAEASPPAPKVKAAPKPKAARKPKPPVEDSSDSSDVDETVRNVYNHIAKPDMETAILQFLVNRKQSESTRPRELWRRLAQM